MKNDKVNHKYLIGWQGDSQIVYGKDECSYGEIPLTFSQMKKEIKKFPHGTRKNVLVVYELKPYCKLRGGDDTTLDLIK